MPEDKQRWKPFAPLYPRWDEKKFDASNHMVRPKKGSANRSPRARIWENIMEGLSKGRQDLLSHIAKKNDIGVDNIE